VPQSWIVGVQFYRSLGVVFLMLYAAGKFPGLFALPAGLGDVAVGLSAPFVAFAYARNRREGAGAVRAWNMFGILDLVVAVTMGFLTSPSAITPLEVHPTSELITMMPMVMIPVYMVPLSIVLHIASLVKLHREEARAAGKGMAQARALVLNSML
jgi:fatty acid desaturase